MLNIPISQIARYMESHKNEPLPFEYAEILIGELQQAHRAGWEQAKEACADLINDMLERRPFGELADFSDACANTIAALEYKEPTND